MTHRINFEGDFIRNAISDFNRGTGKCSSTFSISIMHFQGVTEGGAKGARGHS